MVQIVEIYSSFYMSDLTNRGAEKEMEFNPNVSQLRHIMTHDRILGVFSVKLMRRARNYGL
jgi:hypothetical protein